MRIERLSSFNESRSLEDKKDLVERLELELAETIDYYKSIGRRFLLSIVSDIRSIIYGNSHLNDKVISEYDVCILYTEPNYSDFGSKGDNLDFSTVVDYGKFCLDINMDILDSIKRLGLESLVDGSNSLKIILLK